MIYKDKFNQAIQLTMPKNVKTIGISMSGGADSSLLCYLLARQIKEEKLDVKISPITAKFSVRPWSYDVSRTVTGFISSALDFDNWGDHWKFDVTEYECQTDARKEYKFDTIVQFLILNKKIDFFYSGKTKNPAQEIMNTFHDKQYQEDRQNPNQQSIQKSEIEHVPYAMVDKRLVLSLYKDLDLLDTLFPLTRSCEGDRNITNNFTTTCGKCWWCEERNWAYQEVIND